MINKGFPVFVSKMGRYCFWPVFLVVLYLSFANNKVIDAINADQYPVRLDYVFHFLAYMGLVIGYRIGHPQLRLRRFLLSPGFVITLLLAIASEAAQFYIPWRTFNWYDMGMNVAGVLCGVVINFIFL